MYTVILYRNAAVIGIEKYRFLFSDMVRNDQLMLCPIKGWENIEEVVVSVNHALGQHYMWRLLIAGEKIAIPEKGEKIDFDKLKIRRIIKFYAGLPEGDEKAECKSYPEEIWYVGWTEYLQEMEIQERIPFRSDFPMIDNFYAFCMLMDMSSEMERKYSEFKMGCALQIMSANQFPAGFLSCNYLYFLILEMDKRKFSEYVCTQYEVLGRIRQMLENENDQLQQDRQGTFPCPEQKGKYNSMLKHDEASDLKTIKMRINWRNTPDKMDYEMDRNAQEVRRWMHYPKGVMRGELSSLSEYLDNQNLAGGFLSEAGNDRLKWEKRNILEKLSGMQKVLLNQRDFERKFLDLDYKIRKKARKQLSGMERNILYILSAVMQAFFVRCVMETSKWKVLWAENGIMKFLVLTLVIFVFFIAVNFISRYLTKKKYVDFLKKEMENKINKAEKAYKRAIQLIGDYQYYVRVDMEQDELERKWKESEEFLSMHWYIYDDGRTAFEQLCHLLDKEERQHPVVKAPYIDFNAVPQEMLYYWPLRKSNTAKTELNQSGYYLSSMPGFVRRFWCTEIPIQPCHYVNVP